MTDTVFLSGSRKINRLNEAIRRRIENMIDRGFNIVIGDASGADKALQGYLADANYNNVKVFCAGSTCRNNIGEWNVKNIDVDSKLRGRDFYTQKDKAMALEADYGFVLWDGKSTGSINNILELLKGLKSVVVYFAPEKAFYTLKKLDDVSLLLNHCNEIDYRKIVKKTRLDRHLARSSAPAQGSLGF